MATSSMSGYVLMLRRRKPIEGAVFAEPFEKYLNRFDEERQKKLDELKLLVKHEFLENPDSTVIGRYWKSFSPPRNPHEAAKI